MADTARTPAFPQPEDSKGRSESAGGVDRRTALAALAIAPIGAATRGAAVERLTVGDRLARFDLLKPGVTSYLISSVHDGHHTAQEIWRRTVSFDTVDGRRMLRISQRWDGVGPDARYVERESLFEPGTFRPSLHTRITQRGGTRTVEGFLFGDRAITGLPGLDAKARADFRVASDEAMYNFETDMEMLQTLPWRHGYAVSIPFFHPAVGSVPARYLWAVGGEETIAGPDGRPIACWIVTCDYNRGGAPARFWITKYAQRLVRMDAPDGSGGIHRKTLLI